jgi:spore coat polysaccharide biosynthesis protein SpsF
MSKQSGFDPKDVNVRIGVIIQARTGSTRFPKKVIKPFAGELSILDVIVNRLQELDLPIVVATTTSPEDDIIEEMVMKLGCQVYRGDESNVLSRFTNVTTKNAFDFVVRVCADNPFLNLGLLKRMLEKANQDRFEADYYTFRFLGKPAIATHLGIFCELIKSSALKIVQQRTTNTLYLEHVTNFIYSNPQQFQIKFLDFPWEYDNLESIRLTIDTKADFNLSKKLFNKVIKMNPRFTFENIMDILKTYPEFMDSMASEMEKYPKG